MQNITSIKSKKTLLIAISFLLQVITYSQTQIGLDINGQISDGNSGSSVSMPDSKTIAIGAQSADGVISQIGHARVFNWNGTNWVQKGLDLDGEDYLDQFGKSVTMPDSNTIAIGAPSNDGAASDAGHVRIFTWDGSNWIQKGADIDGKAEDDRSGFSVSMPNPNTIAVGSPYNDDGGEDAGLIKVYSWNGANWIQRGSDIKGDSINDQYGFSISMPDSNTIATGIYRAYGKYEGAGKLKVFMWNGFDWIQKGESILGDKKYGKLGCSISMPNSNTIAAGAPYSGQSSVKILTWDGSKWIQKGSDISGMEAFDNFGESVSMPDSNIIAIGARSSSTKYNRAGQAKIYRWTGTAWIQIGMNIEGEARDDQLGFSVSMPNKETFAVGSPFHLVDKKRAGHVKVFSLCTHTFDTIAIYTCGSLMSPSKKYLWTKSGEYQDTIPNVGGCDSIITMKLSIDTIDISVTNLSPALIANSKDAIFQWLNCDNNFSKMDGDTNQVFLALNNGNFAVEVSRNSCRDTSICISVNNANTFKRKNDSEYQLFPNPTHGDVRISLGKSHDIIQIKVRNIVGQEIIKTEYSNMDSVQFNIPGIDGIYFVEVQTELKKAYFKVIKK